MVTDPKTPGFLSSTKTPFFGAVVEEEFISHMYQNTTRAHSEVSGPHLCLLMWRVSRHETRVLQHVQQHILEGSEGGFAGRQAVFEISPSALNLPVKSE